MDKQPDNETRTRILDAADRLFSTRGYAAVRLRDIAEAVGLRHASLYYYTPGGKDELFIQVMERNLQRHRAGLEQAIADAGEDLRGQMHAIAHWLVSQPPLDFTRMHQADLPAIAPDEARRLGQFAYDALRQPIAAALGRSVAHGTIKVRDLDMAAMALVSLVQSVHGIPVEYRSISLETLGEALADMLLDGWRVR